MTRGIAWQEMKQAFELRKPITWDQLHPGKTFSPYVLTITPELVDSIVSLTNDQVSMANNVLVSGIGTERRVAPQVLTMILGRLSYLGKEFRTPPGSVLKALSFEFLEPMKVTDTITATGSVKERAEKRGARQYTITSKMVNQTGKTVSTMEVTVMLPDKEDSNSQAN